MAICHFNKILLTPTFLSFKGGGGSFRGYQILGSTCHCLFTALLFSLSCCIPSSTCVLCQRELYFFQHISNSSTSLEKLSLRYKLLVCQFSMTVVSFPFLQILKRDNQLRNANQELQQRAIEYLKLSSIASDDLLVR